MVMLALPLVLLNMIRNLKWLAPFSMIANLLMATGVGITFYYIFIDLPSVDDRPHFTSLHQLPLFFGTAIFALEGIGVVRKLHIYLINKMFVCRKFCIWSY
jgi:proton-coupled amino acid transporter